MKASEALIRASLVEGHLLPHCAVRAVTGRQSHPADDYLTVVGIGLSYAEGERPLWWDTAEILVIAASMALSDEAAK